MNSRISILQTFYKLSTTTDAPNVWFVFFFAENKDLKMCLENLNKQIKHLFLSSTV